ncbi:hypothetical protein, partial [Methanothrix soehngenii]|uniref:hypothetical protein n=1 Tax=Methanothrix soehngenii TaxID=2223 RepID=UPI002A36BE0A
GYVFALDQEEITVWESTSEASLTDIMLNSSTEYYINWEGPTNNSQLYYQEFTEGYWIDRIMAPDYVSTGSTYTSLPVYDEISGDITLASSASMNVAIDPQSDPYGGVQSHGLGDDLLYDLPVMDYYYVGFPELSQIGLYNNGVSVLTTMATGSLELVRNGSDSWSFDAGGTTYTVDAFYVSSDRQQTYTVWGRNYTPINISGDYVSAIGTGLTGVKVVHHNGSVDNVVIEGATSLLKTSSGYAVVDGVPYDSVSQLSIVRPAGISILQYTATAAVEGEYADVSAGWTVPGSGNPFVPYWMNGQTNSSVSLCVHIEEGRDVFLEPLASVSDTAPWVHIIRGSDGLVTVAHDVDGDTVSVVLGEYSDLYVTITRESYIISGIPSWPAMGTSPSTLHTVTLDHDLQDDFNFIEIAVPGDYYEDVRLRVDSAQIVAGDFPSTKDYTLDMNALFPAKSYSVRVHSIGVYGDSLTLAGVSLPVTNGTVTVNDRTIALRGADISCIDRDGDGIYVTSIGTEEVGTTTGPGSIYLEGEWSLTATAYILEEVTSTQLRWQPGEFGFDETGFIVVGLIACLGAFVGLGMYGRRSGAKVGVLMLICGGTAMVLLMMV